MRELKKTSLTINNRSLRQLHSLVYGRATNLVGRTYTEAVTQEKETSKVLSTIIQMLSPFKPYGNHRSHTPRFGFYYNHSRSSDTLGLYKLQAQKILRNHMESLGITPEEIINEIVKVAFAKDDKPLSKETEQGETIVFSAKDKLKALEMLARIFGLYEKDNAQKAANNQVLQIAFVDANYAEQAKQLEVKNKAIQAESATENKATLEKYGDLLHTKLTRYGRESREEKRKKKGAN